MSERTIFPVTAETAENAHIDAAAYEAMYRRSIEDPEGFWAEQARRLDWIKPFTRVKDVSWARDDLHIRWFEDGSLNASANCLDRHLAERGGQNAIIWEGDDPAISEHITYRDLHERVCKFANVLKARGVKRGDRVTIYLPMIPEIAVAVLACARIGAIHSVVFGGFSPEALAGRITDCASTVVVTADEGLRGGRAVPLKANTDAALASCPDCTTCIVVRRTGGEIGWVDGRDYCYDEEMATASADCPPEEMGAEDPLFILYTSGSTGQPKGVLHTTGGYLTFASMTHEFTFDYRDGEVFWCTADVGWVTGHSYILYGPPRQRRGHADVRGRAELSGQLAFLAGLRQAQCLDLLHRAHGDPRADARGRRPGEGDLAQEPAHPRHGRRADQPGGLALVLRCGGRRPLPHRRYLVADRDRRAPDHPPAGRDRPQARLRHQAVLRRQARPGGQ